MRLQKFGENLAHMSALACSSKKKYIFFNLDENIISQLEIVR
jgi:hypothetical protein